ncbi:7549_t:CDS:2, partial [Funneliformis mosseae]
QYRNIERKHLKAVMENPCLLLKIKIILVMEELYNMNTIVPQASELSYMDASDPSIL